MSGINAHLVTKSHYDRYLPCLVLQLYPLRLDACKSLELVATLRLLVGLNTLHPDGHCCEFGMNQHLPAPSSYAMQYETDEHSYLHPLVADDTLFEH